MFGELIVWLIIINWLTIWQTTNDQLTNYGALAWNTSLADDAIIVYNLSPNIIADEIDVRVADALIANMPSLADQPKLS